MDHLGEWTWCSPSSSSGARTYLFCCLKQRWRPTKEQGAAACIQHGQIPQNGAFPWKSNMKTQLVTVHQAQPNFQPFSFLLINKTILRNSMDLTMTTKEWSALIHRWCYFYLNPQVYWQYSEPFTPWGTHALERRHYEDCSQSAGTERQNWRNRPRDHYKIEQRTRQFEIWQNEHTKLSCTTNLFLQKENEKKRKKDKTRWPQEKTDWICLRCTSNAVNHNRYVIHTLLQEIAQSQKDLRTQRCMPSGTINHLWRCSSNK